MTDQEFDVAMAAAKLEKQRALRVASVNKSRGHRVTDFNLARIHRAGEVLDGLQRHPVFIARLEKRAEEKRMLKRESDKRYAEKHRAELNARGRAASKRRTLLGLAAAYRAQPHVRDAMKARKEKKRREAGAVPLVEILARAVDRAVERAALSSQRRAAKADFLSGFIGPPVPRRAMTEAEYYQWRINTQPDFYAKELDRAQRYKARTRPGYRDSIVRWSETPQSIKEIKHLQYLIARQIERNEQHENNQRT